MIIAKYRIKNDNGKLDILSILEKIFFQMHIK